MVCCVCLLENPDIMGIFDALGQQLKVAEVIHKHFWIKPLPNDLLTSDICTICWHKIDDFNLFYQTVEKAHKEYQQIHHNQTTIKEEEKPCFSTIKLEQEEIFEGSLMQTELEIDFNLETKNPLEEVHNIEVYDEETENECGGTSDEYEPSDMSDHESSNEEETLMDIKTKNIEDFADKKTSKRKANNDSEKNKEVAKKKRTFNRLDPVYTEEMIKKHIPMGCNMCVFVGGNFSDIVEHFKAHHPNVRPYIMCCDKKLTKRFYVAQHALKHEDPNCFRCEQCIKSFASIRGLRAHSLKYHPSEEECIHECVMCPKKFARRNLLELHKTSHIPRAQWQFFCKQCPPGKIFASDFLLNIHTSMQHKKEKNICQVCAKEIKDKKSFEKHVRLHFEDSGPRLKCLYPNCESWLKDEENLKIHMRRHDREDNAAGKIYKCPECDKVCSNSNTLKYHKQYSHSNKIFTCDVCDKTFKRAITLREHMTQHTGETLYKCPFCPKTFNSNANMHSHKKKQHPVEWEEWRIMKRGSAQALING